MGLHSVPVYSRSGWNSTCMRCPQCTYAHAHFPRVGVFSLGRPAYTRLMPPQVLMLVLLFRRDPLPAACVCMRSRCVNSVADWCARRDDAALSLSLITCAYTELSGPRWISWAQGSVPERPPGVRPLLVLYLLFVFHCSRGVAPH